MSVHYHRYVYENNVYESALPHCPLTED